MDSVKQSAVAIILFLLLIPHSQPAQQLPAKNIQTKPAASLTSPDTASNQLFNINNITLWGNNTGASGNRWRTSYQGSSFPRGTARFLYADHFLWGGRVYLNTNRTIAAGRQPTRVGGGHYNEACKPGRIVGIGAQAKAVDPLSPDARYYRIRRDYARMTQDELRLDAAESNEILIGQVTQTQMDAVRSQYEKDWKEWPAGQGAPFIERNGIPGYQTPPSFSATFTADSLISGRYDEPGIAGPDGIVPADQALWCVYNDLDSTLTVRAFKSYPIGLELQMTSWGFNRDGPLGNVIFRRLRIINKGGVDTSASGSGGVGAFYIDSMYVAQFADIDLGSASDDNGGCDTSLQLNYVYNGQTSDAEYAKFNLPPPAAGYAFLQGPRVPSPSDSAIFDFKRLFGWKNLHQSSYMQWKTGDPYSEPYGGTYDSLALTWWKVLRGYLPLIGQEQLWPSASFPKSKFPFSGDPVNGTGWVDGLGGIYSFPPGDMRICPAIGPFSLAPGDTQEVVIALVASLGADRLSSIAEMKHVAQIAQLTHHTLYSMLGPPTFQTEISYPDSTRASIKITADGRKSKLSGLNISLKRPSGQVVTTMQLFDDGAHGDSSANDGIFANTLTITRQDSGLTLSATARDVYQNTYTLEKAAEYVTTAGPVELINPVIFSDNLNNDGTANPGENVRYGFTLRNGTPFALINIRVASPTDFLAGKTITWGYVGAGQSAPLTYDINYFSAVIPAGYRDSIYSVPFVAYDHQSNRWNLIVNFSVVQPSKPFQYSLLTHTSGKADGSFSILVVDAQSVRNHMYAIMGVDSIDTLSTPGFALKDSTDGRILLTARPLPDTIGHGTPITDGFKLLRGTIPDPFSIGVKNWSIPSGQRRWSWENANYFFSRPAGFNGAIDWDEPAARFAYVRKKTLKPSALKNVLIKFAATDTSGTVLTPADPNWSFGYRYLRRANQPPAGASFAPFIKNPGTGYAYQDYLKSVPLSAWDVEASPPRRLMIGFLENNVESGMVDGKYWPPASTAGISNTSTLGPREWFFIFDVSYSESPDARLTKDILNNGMPVMWWGTPTRNGNTAFYSNDVFLIETMHAITGNDRWVFNPTILVGVEKPLLPIDFNLSQNYPNPFNPSTTIEFSIPTISHVSLKIYNLLGQEVTILVDERMNAGRHTVRWEGKNRQGISVTSGVYFYRIVAGDFVETKKMLVLR